MTIEEVRNAKTPFYIYNQTGVVVRIHKVIDGNFDFHPKSFQTIARGKIINGFLGLPEFSEFSLMFFENSKIITKKDNPEYFI